MRFFVYKSLFFETQNVFWDTEKLFLTFSEVKGGRPNCGSTNSTSSNNNRKSTNNKPHKQQQVVVTATQFSTKTQENIESSNGNSTTNILEGQKRTKIGFSTVGDLKAPAAAATKQQKQQQKNRKQQPRTARKTAHTTRKASIK